MKKYLFFDSAKCSACGACALACIDQNDVDVASGQQPFRHTFTLENKQGDLSFYSVSCMHCADAPCVKVCPTGASYVADDGTVQIDAEKCIGCKYCLAACPYQARYATESGEAGKCSFCHHRTTEGMLPACVGTCVTSARYFGDLNDPDSDISKEIVATNAQPIAGDLTKSKVFYVR